MELEKHDTSSQVLADSNIPQMVVQENVDEGDDNDNMLIGDDLPVKRQEESHVS